MTPVCLIGNCLLSVGERDRFDSALEEDNGFGINCLDA